MGLLAWAFWKILLPPGRHVTPWLLTSCQHGFLWAAKLELLWQAARALRRLWGPKVASWCQSAFIEKPNSEGKRLPCFIHCTELAGIQGACMLAHCPWFEGLAFAMDGMEKGIICTVAFDVSHHCHIVWMAVHRDGWAQSLLYCRSSHCPMNPKSFLQKALLDFFFFYPS